MDSAETRMPETTKGRDVWWWYWVLTLVFIAAALLGWPPGYGVVILLSAVHAGHSFLRHKSVVAFPVQIRLAFFGLTLFGLWALPRVFIYVLLLIGTFMVAALGRCGIGLALKQMPWNRDREIMLD
jgi:hypothetical protein